MGFAGWLIAIGALLIVMYATSHIVARLPASPALIYFAIGIAAGPWGFDWLHPDPEAHAALLEHACELALVVSLFVTGSTVGSTLRVSHWRTPVRLATVAMTITIALLALFAHTALGFTIGAALFLAAALAPTDPVLASDVQVANAKDRDGLRFGLTGEAGLNDGAALPFVLAGLALLQVEGLAPESTLLWLASAAWGVVGGLGLGAGLGFFTGRWIVRRLRKRVQSEAAEPFLGLGLVAVVYGLATALHAYGFLAVFAASVALQWAAAGEGRREGTQAGAADRPIEALQQFNADLERLLEFAIVIVAGALFTIVDVPLSAIAVAAVLFLAIRPASVLIALRGTPLVREQRALASWFGIRGVGSLYYVFFALAHGWHGAEAERALGIVLGVVAISIFVHGISVTPLMSAYERHARWSARRKATTTRRA